MTQSTDEKMDADSTSLTSRDCDSAAELLSPMDVVSPQAQNVDASQDLDGNLNNAAQLKSNENSSPATETLACDKPAGSVLAVPALPCQSIATSADVEMQNSMSECSQRMEIGSQENADSSSAYSKEECFSMQNEVNEENRGTCQCLDEHKSSVSKTEENGQDSEALPTIAQPGAIEASLTVDNAASSSIGKNIGNIVRFSDRCSL